MARDHNLMMNLPADAQPILRAQPPSVAEEGLATRVPASHSVHLRRLSRADAAPGGALGELGVKKGAAWRARLETATATSKLYWAPCSGPCFTRSFPPLAAGPDVHPQPRTIDHLRRRDSLADSSRGSAKDPDRPEIVLMRDAPDRGARSPSTGLSPRGGRSALAGR